MPLRMGQLLCINDDEAHGPAGQTTMRGDDSGHMGAIPTLSHHPIFRKGVECGAITESSTTRHPPIRVRLYTCEVCGYVEMYKSK